jgi:polar amino acid transport system permease protein
LLFINCRIFGVPPLLDLLPPLLLGLKVTVALTIGGTVVATVAAFAAGLAQLSHHWPLRVISILYIDLFRGTSALVQLFWAYFALPLLGIVLSAMTTGIWVLGLNIGAYGAEVVRGAIQAIPKKQWEAAIALNFTPRQTLWRIIIPQALPAMLPPFGNLLIELLKSTALVSMIALSDLTFQAQILRASTLRTTEIFLLVLILYFLLAQAIAFIVHRLERQFSIEK